MDQTYFSGEQDLLSFIQQETQSPVYRQACRKAEESSHPLETSLYEYVLDQLPEEVCRAIENHLAVCGVCANEVLRIMRLEEDLEDDARQWVNMPTSSDIHNSVAVDYWEPQWLGMQTTAADIPQQTHVFRMKEGNVRILCNWGEAHGSDPAYIWVSWEACLTEDKVLCIRFLNPENGHIRHEACLGEDSNGEETFNRHELGFDPSRERWAVAIL